MPDLRPHQFGLDLSPSSSRDQIADHHTHGETPNQAPTPAESLTPSAVPGAAGGSIAARFEVFHAQHPDVYEHLRRLALSAKRRGCTEYGIKSLWEVMRWELVTSGRDLSGFKANNNFTAHYARKLMDNEPELAGFFRTRELRAA